MQKLHYFMFFIVVSGFLFFQKETLQQNPKLLIFVFPLFLIIILQVIVGKYINTFKNPIQQQLEDDYGVEKTIKDGSIYRVFLIFDDLEFKTLKLSPLLLGKKYFTKKLIINSESIIFQDGSFQFDIQILFKKIKGFQIEPLHFGNKALHLEIEKYLDLYILSDNISEIFSEIKEGMNKKDF